MFPFSQKISIVLKRLSKAKVTRYSTTRPHHSIKYNKGNSEKRGLKQKIQE